jgi:DNA repair exonuclease SbcCD nuclease subunit
MGRRELKEGFKILKILHTADIHLGALAGDLRLEDSGLQHRVQIALSTLDYMIDYANQNCQAMIIAGDIFDAPSPSTRLLHEFNKRIQTAKIPVIIVLGQHDQPKSKRGHTSFPYQYDNSLVIVADTPRVVNIGGHEFICIPYSQQIKRSRR